MRRSTSLVLALSIAGLGGCATREGFEARQQALVGRTEAELVQAIGVPSGAYEVDGRRFMQYDQQRVVSAPVSVGLFGFGRGFGMGGGFGPSVYSRSCSVTFEIRQGRVAGFVARGDDCVATAPG